ncbi:transposase [Rhodococcus aetherivorans]
MLPGFRARPQGGGRATLDDRAVFAAIVYVLTSGCAWRHLPPSFGVSVPTSHRRFATWSTAEVFDELHRQVQDDSVMLQPMMTTIPAVRSRRGPRRRRPGRLRADKGYDYPVHRQWLRARGIVPRIARRGVDSSERLGWHRWKSERTLAWLTGYRRLTMRYERYGEHFAGFLQLAAALTCWKKLAK